jgi:hypothetical protein
MYGAKRTRRIATAITSYLQSQHPELCAARRCVWVLDGPCDGPRYAVSVERCTVAHCPFGVAASDAEAGRCGRPSCALRSSLRLLLDGKGMVLQVCAGHTHWT